MQTKLSVNSKGTHLVNGILAGGKQILVGTAAHIEEKLVSIADLNQKAGSNLQAALSEVTTGGMLPDCDHLMRLRKPFAISWVR